MSKSSWRSTSTLREKEWGKEKLWRHPSGFTGKVLYINEGSSTAFKYFLIKDESFMVLKGKLMITFGQQRSLDDPCNYPIRKEIFNEGDVLLVQSCCPYRIKALEDSVVIEISNRSDSQRVNLNT